MKVVIYIFGEGDIKSDTLESRMVPVFSSHLKYSFENNGVPTVVLETDKKIGDDIHNFTEITNLLRSKTNVFDELRKAQEITNNLNHLPDRWRTEAEKTSNCHDEHLDGWSLGVKWCADELENLRK